MDVNYLNNVAERIYGVYIDSHSRSRYGAVKEAADSVVGKYFVYSPAVVSHVHTRRLGLDPTPLWYNV
ncbi:hypothetical protein [Pyrobaculum sp.]|uniref:hypothetical protein n=1 Tax=Pyrobaculum sp. TaxID=2004705 RepID=UPI003D11E354